jgi:hypothetical protein
LFSSGQPRSQRDANRQSDPWQLRAGSYPRHARPCARIRDPMRIERAARGSQRRHNGLLSVRGGHFLSGKASRFGNGPWNARTNDSFPFSRRATAGQKRRPRNGAPLNWILFNGQAPKAS